MANKHQVTLDLRPLRADETGSRPESDIQEEIKLKNIHYNVQKFILQLCELRVHLKCLREMESRMRELLEVDKDVASPLCGLSMVIEIFEKRKERLEKKREAWEAYWIAKGRPMGDIVLVQIDK